MKRYHQESGRTKRVHQTHLRVFHNWPVQPVDCICDLQSGRFRKRKALGCQKVRCLLCKFDKIFSVPTVKDKIEDQRFADSFRSYIEPGGDE